MSTGHLAKRLQAAIGDRPLELVICDGCYRIDDVDGDASLFIIPRLSLASLDLAQAIVERRWDADVVQHLHQFTVARLQANPLWSTPHFMLPQQRSQVVELYCALKPAILIRVPARAPTGVWLDLWAAIVDAEVCAYRALNRAPPAADLAELSP